MAKNYPKVVDTLYAVLVNDQILDTFNKLAEARKMVRAMRIGEDVQEVKIVKQCTSQTVLDVLKPEIQRTLSFADFDWTGDEQP